MKSFKAYERASSVPSKATLRLVDDLLPRTAEIFQSGPRTSRHVLDGKKNVLVTSTAPMWLALGGSAEACKAVLVWYDKELGSMLASHADVLTLAKQATRLFHHRRVGDERGAFNGNHVLQRQHAPINLL